MNTTAVDDGPDEAAMQAYLREGERRAFALGNRGPLRFEAGGALHASIEDAYRRLGFYVFEGVLGAEEVADLQAGYRDMRERLPCARDSALDSRGRPALGVGGAAPSLFWSKPLADPLGGTGLASGRHAAKMHEPTPAPDAPDEIVYMILGALRFSEAFLRVCGHPGLLAVAGALNGDDFVPLTEALFVKEPGRGASVAWHQDGTTHWNSPHWDAGSHGVNFMAQVYASTPANGVWVVPGTHALGKQDIVARVARAGSDRLPDAVPMVCGPGDVVISNRQLLHGSFANTSEHPRVSLVIGFARRASVSGVKGGGIFNPEIVYDEACIRERCRVIGYAIDARRRRFPAETPFSYRPFVESGENPRWDEAARAGFADYNALDLSI